MEEFKIGDTVTTIKEGDHYEVHKETGFKFKVGEISFFNDDKLLVIENEFSAVRASRCKLVHREEKEKTILEKAQEIIYGDRERDYGTVTENFGRISNLWTAYLNGRSEINPSDVGMMMVLMKVARQANGHKDDNLVDIAGYVGCVEKLNKGL